MSDFDPKMLEKLKKLENLQKIEARLIRQERTAHTSLVAGMLLALFAFAVLLGFILDPTWLP